MSKLGFDISLKRLSIEERRFLQRGMTAAQKEFKRNFDGELNSETGKDWEAVLRGYPPPILDVTGKLRAEALSKGNVKITRGKAVLTVDPHEEGRNRPYAAYHMEGTKYAPPREFITQSSSLTKQQENLRDEMFERIFR